MMEQLWYTWSTEGLGGGSGYRVRAASDGLTNLNSDRFRSFRGYLTYFLPQDSDPYAATMETSPVCLAFVDPPNDATKDPNDQHNTHIIMQKVYKGKDALGRAGVFFIHVVDLLTDTPNDFVASDAIELWKSPFWRVSDTPPPIDDVKLRQVKRDELQSTYQYPVQQLKEVEGYLEFVIEAFLSLQPEQKLYIAGEPERVATLIWGLTHSLPRPLQRAQNLTFSVYEQNVTKVAARVVGTCHPMVGHQNAYLRSQQLLPAESFSGRGPALALDCYTRPPSHLEPRTDIAKYAQFATQCLTSGKKQSLDNLLASANESNVTNTGKLMLIFKVYRKALQEGLTPDEITSLLEDPKLATGLLAEEVVQRNIIDMCVKNPRWWQEHGGPEIKNLRGPFDIPSEQRLKEALASLATYAAQEMASSLLGKDKATVEATEKLLLVAAPPQAEPTPWLYLLHSLSTQLRRASKHPSETLSWERHSWLLQKWAYSHKSIEPTLILPWLQMGWSDLYKLLELREKLPEAWRQVAIAETISQYANKSTPHKDHVLFWMKYHYDLFVGGLLRLMTNPATRPAVLWYFNTLVNYGYKDKDRNLLFHLLYASSQTPDQDIEDFLQVAQLNTKEKLALLGSHGEMLLAHRITPSIIRIIGQYIGKLSPDTLERGDTKRTLQLLYQYSPKLPEELAWQVEDWFFVSACVPPQEDQETYWLNLEPDLLYSMGEAIKHLRMQDNNKFKEGLLYLLVTSIQTEENLNDALELLAPALSRSPIDLLWELVEYRGKWYKPKKLSYTWLMPYLVVVLKKAVKFQGQKRNDFLDDLLSLLLQNANDQTFDDIRADVGQWKNGELCELWYQWRRNRPNRGIKALLPLQAQKPVQDAVPRREQPSAEEKFTTSPHPSEAQIRSWQNRINSPHPPARSDPASLETIRTETVGGYLWNPPQQPRQVKLSSHEQPAVSVDQITILPPNQPRKQSPASNDPFVRGSVQHMQGKPPASQPQSSRATPEVPNRTQAPLPEELVTRVHAVKFLYIEVRHPQVSKEMDRLYQKKEPDIEGINDELDELRNHTKDARTTRRMLQNDLIIQNGLTRYEEAQAFYDEIFFRVYEEVRKSSSYKKTSLDENDVKEMLAIFVRYRVLNRCLRQQASSLSIKDWLLRERMRSHLPIDDL